MVTEGRLNWLKAVVRDLRWQEGLQLCLGILRSVRPRAKEALSLETSSCGQRGQRGNFQQNSGKRKPADSPAEPDFRNWFCSMNVRSRPSAPAWNKTRNNRKIAERRLKRKQSFSTFAPGQPWQSEVAPAALEKNDNCVAQHGEHCANGTVALSVAVAASWHHAGRVVRSAQLQDHDRWHLFLGSIA